ncbi:MAG: gliding motility-associated C-terminal domain-containing protein [Bacteroidetes bacterium]|nr:gliding motility-associated C-terminal domain-containing protein [Bacteroidota bacterium]
MKTTIKSLLFCLLLNVSLTAQTYNNPLPGTPCPTCYIAPPTSSGPKGNSNNNVMNGNGSLATTYTQTACGLGFTQVSARLHKRVFGGVPPGTGTTQPCPVVVSGIPAGAIIQAAFLYAGGSGQTGSGNFNATITNPSAVSQVFAMSQVGFHTDKCWGYGGTWTSRANITSIITGNGTYSINGCPVMPQTPSKDTDGATIFIVYVDPALNITGSIVIADGCFVGIGGTINNVISGFNVCGNPTSTSNFMVVGDLQQISAPNIRFNSLVNNATYPIASQKVWDYIQAPGAPAVNGQTTANYGLTSTGDCYAINVCGMYYQTGPCLTVTAASTPSCPTSNATVTVLGGNPAYTYTWTPTAQSTSVATNLLSGTYTVNVADNLGCKTGSAVVSVTTTPLNPITITGGTICTGSAANLTANGAPTYTWAPPATLNTISGPNVTANPMATTIYSVSFTNTAGCVGTQTTQVIVNPTPTIATVSNNGPVCQGSPVTLSVNSSVAGTTTYGWTGPNGYNSSTQNPAIPSPVPNDSGTYSVTVTNTFTNGGVCFSSGSTNMAVVPVSPVVVTPSFTLCQGANLNLISGASGAVSYSWTGPAYNSVLQNPSIPNLMPANSGDYSVTAYFTSPVTTLVCTSNAVTNVSVVPTSPVNVTVPTNLCQYATANISALAPGAISYSWIGPNNFSSNLQATAIPNIQPSGSGTYFSTATFAIGSVSCTITGSNQISVVPVNPVIVTPTISICEPSNAYFNSSSQGAVTFSWSGPATFTANGPSPSIYFATPAATGIYTVYTSYNNGSLICYNNNTVQLTVNPRITFTLDAYRQMCYNSLLNVNGPAGATTYTWTGSTGFSSNSQNLTIPSIQPNQSGTYTLNVQLGPCITSQKIQIEVLTPLAYTLTPPNQTICRGDSVKLIVGSTGGSQNYAYVWTPGVFLGSPTGSVQYGHPIGTTVYNLAGYDIACPNYTVFYTFTVTVGQPPMPDLQLEKDKGCEPLCLFFNTKTQNQAAVTTYDFGGGQIMQADSFYHCLNEPGTYYLKISSLGKNGCRGVYDYPEPIIVWPKPHSDFNWDPDVVTTSNNQVTFNPMYKYGPITSINWMFSGTGINGYDTSNIQHPQRVFENPGKYPVMLIQRTDKGCIDSVVKFIDIIEDFNVFIPNTFTPNGDGLNDIFNIKGLGLKATGYSMELFDRWGHSMYQTKDVTKGWDGTVKGQPAQDGVYIYKIYAVGANGEGKKEYIGHVTLMK